MLRRRSLFILDTKMRALRSFAQILAGWSGIALVAMLTTFIFPRTLVGLLLSFTVVPAIYIAMHGVIEATAAAAPVRRFHEWVERRTRADKISGFRIFAYVTEILLFIAILAGLWLAVTRTLDLDTSAFEAFRRRHFWPYNLA